ncbi:MAG: RsmE family RNA methyltransferase [Oligoflexia bacterium]|nr:RsmE family RNA methyltransferase [Oligoflexia bacterium]
MRAVFLKDIELFETLELKDEKFHHLIKVLRIKKNYKVLVLNGLGQSRLYEVKEVLKKSCIIQSQEDIDNRERKHTPDVMICSPKKEYSENMIRTCVEVGVNKVLFAMSEYSQWHYEESARLDQILSSSMEQSNNHYLPKLINIGNIKEYDFSGYKRVLIFSSQTNKCEPIGPVELEDTLIVIGPEAGFSDEENRLFEALDNKMLINLPVNIMKAVTALPVALGYILANR